jgi:hypothetical protein
MGKGDKIRFWENQWFETCSLAIQYLGIYSIINEQGAIIRKSCDGVNLKFTFRRIVDSETMNPWYELLQIAQSIQFFEYEEAIILQYNSTGRYSVQSLYAIVNNRGVQQIFTPFMWKIHVPPRIYVFLWVLGNGKVLTPDNLAKRRPEDDKTCLFCNEAESVNHIFFRCCVAKLM